MIPAENDSFRLGALDFLDNGGVVNRTRCDTFIKDDRGARVIFQEGLGEFRQPFSVIALVVEYGNLFEAEFVEREFHFQFGLCIIGGDGPEKVGIVATLGQGGVSGGWRHGHHFGILVDTQGGLGSTGADVPENNFYVLGGKFSGGVRGHFRFADIILHNQFHFLAKHAAFGIDILYNEFSSLNSRYTIRGQVTTVGAGHAELDRIGKSSARHGK